MRRPDRELQESQSSRALLKLLADLKSKEAGSITKFADDNGIHRTQLWRYARGDGKPNADQIIKLHRATKGRIAAMGWETIGATVNKPTKKKARKAA